MYSAEDTTELQHWAELLRMSAQRLEQMQELQSEAKNVIILQEEALLSDRFLKVATVMQRIKYGVTRENQLTDTSIK